MNQWINESVNQPWNEWTNEPMSHWINEPTNQESMSQWRNEWTNEVMDGWMNGWMDEWASTVSFATSSCNSARHTSSAMVKNYLSRSCTMRSATSSCNPAYQVRRSITHALLRAAAICHSRLQTRIAGAWHQINQHSRSVNRADFLGCSAALSF